LILIGKLWPFLADTIMKIGTMVAYGPSLDVPLDCTAAAGQRDCLFLPGQGGLSS
jgi:hypothetical protein